MSDIRAGSLRGRAVVSLEQARKIGTVEDIIFDLATGAVVAYAVGVGMLGATKALAPGSIRDIGADAITVPDQVVLYDHSALPPGAPDRAQLSKLLGSKVVSERGVLLGILGEVELDATGSQITAYEMSGTLWDKLRHQERTFAPVPGLHGGQGLLIVPDPVAAALSSRGQEPTPPGDSA